MAAYGGEFIFVVSVCLNTSRIPCSKLTMMCSLSRTLGGGTNFLLFLLQYFPDETLWYFSTLLCKRLYMTITLFWEMLVSTPERITERE